jgi:hypothetical protein
MARTNEFTEIVTEAQKQWIQSVHTMQELTFRSLELATGGYTPKLPAATAVVEGTFNLASQILALQKAYALAAVEAFAPAKPHAHGPKTS